MDKAKAQVWFIHVYYLQLLTVNKLLANKMGNISHYFISGAPLLLTDLTAGIMFTCFNAKQCCSIPHLYQKVFFLGNTHVCEICLNQSSYGPLFMFR